MEDWLNTQFLLATDLYLQTDLAYTMVDVLLV